MISAVRFGSVVRIGQIVLDNERLPRDSARYVFLANQAAREIAATFEPKPRTKPNFPATVRHVISQLPDYYKGVLSRFQPWGPVIVIDPTEIQPYVAVGREATVITRNLARSPQRLRRAIADAMANVLPRQEIRAHFATPPEKQWPPTLFKLELVNPVGPAPLK